MNDKTGRNRGLWDAGALAVAAAAAMLATACSSGPAPTAVAAPAAYTQQTLAQCMRSHGVPGFPDPDASGSYTLTADGSLQGAGKSSIDIQSAAVQAAYGECRHLQPGSPSIGQLEQKLRQARQQEAKAAPELRKFSQCVQSHGGPTAAALSACQHLLPPGAHVSIQTHASVNG